MKNLTVGLTLFRIDMENEIAWNGVTNRNENLDSTRHEGAEGTFSYLWEKRFKIYGSYTYHKAAFEAGPYNGRSCPWSPIGLCAWVRNGISPAPSSCGPRFASSATPI